MTAPLSPGLVFPASTHFRLLSVVLPIGVSFDDALDPSFWANNAKEMPHLSRVYLSLHDRSAVMDTIVCDHGPGFVRLKDIGRHELSSEGATIEEADPVYVKYGNIATRWQIIRRKDGFVLKEGIHDKGDAQREALDYSRRLAA